MITRFYINDIPVDIEINEVPLSKNKGLLIENDKNFFSKIEENKYGFIVKKNFLDNISDIQNNVNSHLVNSLSKYINSEVKDFFTEIKYLNDSQFSLFTKDLYSSPTKPEILGINQTEFEEKVSEIFKYKLKLWSFENSNSPFTFRVVREGQNDFNPPHKDVYLDRLRNKINGFLPIFGCDDHSSLPIVPSSHMIPEERIIRTNENPTINNKKFTVPCICKLDDKDIRLTRPKIDYGDIMFFSPYLIHGGGKNFGSNTRVSIEMRFFSPN